MRSFRWIKKEFHHGLAIMFVFGRGGGEGICRDIWWLARALGMGKVVSAVIFDFGGII